MATDRALLIRCKEHLRNVAKYAEGGRGEFMSSPICQDAILWNLQMACLCAELVSAEERQRHSAVDWRRLRSLAKGLVDDEMRPNLEDVWELAEVHVPELRRQLGLLLTAKV
jgi:uncharacterized protein with HEPN domain